ncbi:4Fe-4S cluster-binding domain-containing protein [Jatrophihabitans sp.]|jgi:anaerobic ribonucleoside-triphosphate reductase activating protein|uniref:4Fe-4S cluster-binding domain-containing protein n=1 Tax=Jatrophihabitans sp. TaxID=1932789 RepID=UPI002EEB219B
MALNRLHFPVTVLGPGRRAGIWFQGCSIGCAGCMSLDTWADRGIEKVPVGAVLDWLESLPGGGADGVTISGGEPTEQPEALRALLDGLAAWRAGTGRDVLLFTGREPAWVRGAGAAVVRGADAVVAGPFVAAEAGTTPLRGSDNQELVVLTERGRQAYDDLSGFRREAVQLGADATGLWLIGIPMPGGLAAFDSGRPAPGRKERRSWR